MSRASRRADRLEKARSSPAAQRLAIEPSRVAHAQKSNRPQTDRNQINSQEGPNWMGPALPLAPLANPQVAGRQFDYPVGYNLQYRPRAYESTSFAELRGLADAYDILRLAIETRRDQMERLTWSFVPKPLPNGEPACDENDPGIALLSEFFEYPDGEADWGMWQRRILEDMFVIDAVSVYPDRMAGGGLLALRQLDGSVISRVIDPWGRTPSPPDVAYQEILKGMPAVNYTSEDLIYAPRNLRVHKVYGYSHVEQVLMSINIGLFRQVFIKDYYTEGNIPEALIGVPEGWTPDQIERFQKWFDAMLRGDIEARRRAYFIPGGINYHETKTNNDTSKLEEWIARVICYAFSLPPTPFITQVNRATAQSAHDAALEEGLAPVQNWVKRFITLIMRRYWPQLAKKIQFTWDDDREVDALVQQQTLTGYVKLGIRSINEVRDILGEPPDPAGNGLRVLTPTGYVMVGLNDDQPTAGEAADTKNKQAEAIANKPAAPVVAAPGATAAAPAKKPTKGEAPATKDAATFRPLKKGAWWNARPAARRPNAQAPGGTSGGETPSE